MLRAAPRRDRESGQALLELALVVPILVLIALAIFQFAFVIESQMGLTNAVREAARRVAATDPAGTPDWGGTYTTWVRQQLCGASVSPCNGGLLEDNVQGFDSSRLPADPDVDFCWYTAAGTINYRVKVAVSYEHPLFFGLLAFATDFVDGSADGRWTLSASAEMRLENVDPAIAGTDPPVQCT
jgi:Flp pilus assembly protein TadG